MDLYTLALCFNCIPYQNGSFTGGFLLSSSVTGDRRPVRSAPFGANGLSPGGANPNAPARVASCCALRACRLNRIEHNVFFSAEAAACPAYKPAPHARRCARNLTKVWALEVERVGCHQLVSPSPPVRARSARARICSTLRLRARPRRAA